MRRIALIGSGQLGSRHLQAIVKEPQPLAIDVIEPSLEAQIMTRERLSQVKIGNPETTVHFNTSISGISKDCEVAVVASGALGRGDLVKTLIKETEIRLFVLEKVLFQRAIEYGEIGDILASSRASAWVNCPRRMFPGWLSLKESMSTSGPFFLSVFGGEWGLACNAIHYIDLAAFLGSSTEWAYSTIGLDSQWIQSKRVGYSEITGLISATSRRGDRISLYSGAGIDVPPQVSLVAKGFRAIVDEASSKAVVCTAAGGWAPSEISFPTKYQSELSGMVIAQLLSKATCPLTPFADSARFHIGFMQALLPHYDPYADRLYAVLPIT